MDQPLKLTSTKIKSQKKIVKSNYNYNKQWRDKHEDMKYDIKTQKHDGHE